MGEKAPRKDTCCESTPARMGQGQNHKDATMHTQTNTHFAYNPYYVIYQNYILQGLVHDKL